MILYPPVGRRSNRGGVGMMRDVLTASVTAGFIGRKPATWTHWVLDALSYNADTDQVIDVFPGSGAVGQAVAQVKLF